MLENPVGNNSVGWRVGFERQALGGQAFEIWSVAAYLKICILLNTRTLK